MRIKYRDYAGYNNLSPGVGGEVFFTVDLPEGGGSDFSTFFVSNTVLIEDDGANGVDIDLTNNSSTVEDTIGDGDGAPIEIPTVSIVGMIALVLLLGLFGARRITQPNRI